MTVQKSVSNNEMFVTLIRVAREDEDIKNRLVRILSLDSFNRTSTLNTFIDELRLKNAPPIITEAISYLLDDTLAAKVLKTIVEN